MWYEKDETGTNPVSPIRLGRHTDLPLRLLIKTYYNTPLNSDNDVEKFAASISITNTIHFEKNEANMKAMFAQESNSRANYSQKIRDKKDTSDDFYKDDDAKTKNTKL